MSKNFDVLDKKSSLLTTEEELMLSEDVNDMFAMLKVLTHRVRVYDQEHEEEV